MIPHEFFLFLAFATLIIALGLIGMADEEHIDARKRNPERRTWDDEA